MKRLLIHVGYPKAASTTLQNGLFLELHRTLAINFVARAWESGHYGALEDKESYKAWLDHIVFSPEFRAEPDGLIENLADDRVNFLSEGLLLMRERHFDHLAMPDRIARYFGPRADKIEILLILRAQSSLVHSYFAQTYQHLKQRSFADYVAVVTKGAFTGRERIFDYRSVVKAYADQFGRENVHIAFFEDFVKDKDQFCADLGKAFGIPASTVKDCLGDTRLNQTKQVAGQSVIKKTTKFKWRTLLTKTMKLVNIDVGDRLRVVVPVATAAEKAQLFEFFRESNRMLAADAGLDEARMRTHGYF